MPRTQHKSWIMRLALVSSAALLMVGLFNLVVDPFGLYRWVVREGFNANKYPATKHARTFKGYLLQDLRPGAIALGSSRTEIGLDPGHPGWAAGGRPVFNLAVGGAAIAETRDLLTAACRRVPPRQVVLGLDLFMFNGYRSGAGESLAETEGTLLRWVKTLWSTAALKASVDTLRKQDPIKYPGYLPNGQIAWTYDLGKIRRYGHHEAFVRNVRKYYESHYFPAPEHRFSLTEPGTGRSSLEPLAEILALARENAIDLRLFISPVHAWQLLAIDQAGLWPVFENWKRELVRLLAADRAAHPSEPPYPLWDFSGFNSITTEPLPLQGDTTTLMNYYWESSHYRKETGDLVLSRIFQLPSSTPPADFGVLLTPDNLSGHLMRARRGLANYRQQHPDAASEVAAVAAQFAYLPQQATLESR